MTWDSCMIKGEELMKKCVLMFFFRFATGTIHKLPEFRVCPSIACCRNLDYVKKMCPIDRHANQTLSVWQWAKDKPVLTVPSSWSANISLTGIPTKSLNLKINFYICNTFSSRCFIFISLSPCYADHEIIVLSCGKLHLPV